MYVAGAVNACCSSGKLNRSQFLAPNGNQAHKTANENAVGTLLSLSNLSNRDEDIKQCIYVSTAAKLHQ